MELEQHTFWLIDHGRIWSSEKAKFVTGDEIPKGTILNRLFDNGVPADIYYLRQTIVDYGCELGELASLPIY